MKRSEMVDIIRDFLVNDLPQDKEYLWKYGAEYAESLLREIEESGMTPPNIHVSHKTWANRENLWDKATQFPVECFVWEPEE